MDTLGTVNIGAITATVKARSARQRRTRVYFGHDGENVIQNLASRFDRPVDLYRTFLPSVAKIMGIPEKSFRWSQKAGCSCGCGCSPGFVCSADNYRDVWVELSAEAPRDQGNPRFDPDVVTEARRLYTEDKEYLEQFEAFIARLPS